MTTKATLDSSKKRVRNEAAATGAPMKRTSASATATTIVVTTWARVSSSSSSPDFCADHDNARKPSWSDSSSTITPRRNGTRAAHEREASRGSSWRIASMIPSGRRTATAHRLGARIMTPSRTA